MDESWNDLLTEFIPKILQANDKQSFEMTICEMTAHLHDGHTGLVNPQVLYDIFGSYRAPVNLTRTKEGQWVVCDLFWDCPLQVGDVILKLDGMDIKEVEESRKKYISVPNDEKVYNALFLYLTSKDEEIEVTVLRSGKEETYTVKGTTGYQYALKRSNTSHEILNGNIGLINPSALPQGDTQMCNSFKDTHKQHALTDTHAKASTNQRGSN